MSKLIQLPDSVIQTQRHAEVSDKYVGVNTESIVTTLEDRGFSVYSAKQSNVRKEENRGFQKHMVWMKFDELETAEGVPSIVIMNSHNRSSSLKLHVGYIRWACSNQLVGGSNISSISLRHSQNWQDKAEHFLSNYMEEVAKMDRTFSRMRNQYMSSTMIQDFSYRAAGLRYNQKLVLDTNELSLVTRSEDVGNNLYVVYNRIQEALMKGSFKRKVENIDDEGIITHSDWSKAPRITSTDETMRINRQISELAMDYL